MFFSIIVGFRNRELSRIKNALDSISRQSYKNFELIFIDYGSEQDVAFQTRQLVSRYSFCNYYYTDTRGWLWNRSHALNTGIKKSKGDVLLIYDIDLIIEADFLKKISILDYQKQFYTFSCFYLPQHFGLQNKDLAKDGIHYEQNYVGLCAVDKSKVLAIKGFDEYYMVWGVEDDDFYNRLSITGLQRAPMPATDFFVYHQWHFTHSPVKPTIWYIAMVNYLFEANKDKNQGDNWGTEYTDADRPILRFHEDDTNERSTRLEFWEDQKLLFFNPFIQKFHQLASGETAYIEYTLPEKEKNKSITRKGVSFFSKPKTINEEIDVKEVINFLQYFIGINRPLLLDYYFEVDKNNVRFSFIKE